MRPHTLYLQIRELLRKDLEVAMGRLLDNYPKLKENYEHTGQY
jgi:hypothetical protein